MHSEDYRKGYAAGYRAGRKETEKERQARRDKVFCAALTGILADPIGSKIGEKQINAPDEYARVAFDITIESMKLLK